MRPSKGEMLQRLDRLGNRVDYLGDKLSEKQRDLVQLTDIVEDLAKRSGYQLVYKNGYYLEPIKEEPYGN